MSPCRIARVYTFQIFLNWSVCASWQLCWPFQQSAQKNICRGIVCVQEAIAGTHREQCNWANRTSRREKAQCLTNKTRLGFQYMYIVHPSVTLLLKAETIYSATHINITGVFTAIAGLFTTTPVTLLTLTIQRWQTYTPPNGFLTTIKWKAVHKTTIIIMQR